MGIVAAAAAMVVLSGCSRGAVAKKSAKPSPTVSAAAVEGNESPTASPEEDFNAIVLGSSFYFDGQGTASAADAMKRYCELLGEDELESRAQWLAEKELVKEDGEAVLEDGIARFCPAHAKTLKAAVDGSYERWFTDGTYEVGSGPDKMPPGSYRTTGALRDCYWERTSRSGEILDNQFATSAQEVRVTVRARDGQFTTRRCGSWKPVK
ncbi:hypothetical protein [Streptomyces halobius]|uniref:DUF732 domain-containing protein n=1 Tax=Streptomyces halobius TaxID=2879846 RepID=A0ABY4MD34_9ACTN|nr:hypothetical protein [Streptomyces halobius]UQA95691.1 hypothetical protein K9S39_30925 [Streptomyces halobius]